MRARSNAQRALLLAGHAQQRGEVGLGGGVPARPGQQARAIARMVAAEVEVHQPAAELDQFGRLAGGSSRRRERVVARRSR